MNIYRKIHLDVVIDATAGTSVVSATQVLVILVSGEGAIVVGSRPAVKTIQLVNAHIVNSYPDSQVPNLL